MLREAGESGTSEADEEDLRLPEESLLRSRLGVEQPGSVFESTAGLPGREPSAEAGCGTNLQKQLVLGAIRDERPQEMEKAGNGDEEG